MTSDTDSASGEAGQLVGARLAQVGNRLSIATPLTKTKRAYYLLDWTSHINKARRPRNATATGLSPSWSHHQIIFYLSSLFAQRNASLVRGMSGCCLSLPPTRVFTRLVFPGFHSSRLPKTGLMA